MATSFGQQTAAYNAGRPEYPVSVVRWMLEELVTRQSPSTIADVGAGTGKLTAAIAEAVPGANLVAIDPDAAMLASLAQRLPKVRALTGTGEALPLPDQSLDAITFGQAWHWVDEPAASRECARALRPGGLLGLIWNVRDPDVPWVSKLTEIMHASEAELHVARGGPTLGPELTAPEVFSERWIRRMTPDEVLAMAASRSYLIAAPPSERERILAELRRFLAEEPALGGGAVIEMPYVTTAFRARKR